MTHEATIDEKGHVTLPASIIDKMGWRTGQTFELSVVGDGITLTVAPEEPARQQEA